VEPTVAIVFSPESWVEELHRHLTDHGGARVRQIVVEPAVALDEEYDTLVVSARWPALTRRFVDALHDRARSVLGVFDPHEHGGKDHLVALNVDAAISAAAAPSQFVSTLVGLVSRVAPSSANRTVASPRHGSDRSAPRISLTVVSGPSGSGCTEVALALAAALAAQRLPAALFDAHDRAPSLATRLGLAVEPNLLHAIDALEHRLGSLEDSMVQVGPGRGFDVLTGFPTAAAALHVQPTEVLEVARALAASHQRVVADVGALAGSPIARALAGVADTIIGVGSGSPVGIARLVPWMADAREIAPHAGLHFVVNRAPRDRYRRSEITDELERTVVPSSLVFVPGDPRVEIAAWDGELVGRGPFTTAIAAVAAFVVPQTTRRVRRGRRPQHAPDPSPS